MAKRFDIDAAPEGDAKTLMLATYRAMARRYSVPGMSLEESARGIQHLHEHGWLDFIFDEDSGGCSFQMRYPDEVRPPGSKEPYSRQVRRASQRKARRQRRRRP